MGVDRHRRKEMKNREEGEGWRLRTRGWEKVKQGGEDQVYDPCWPDPDEEEGDDLGGREGGEEVRKDYSDSGSRVIQHKATPDHGGPWFS
jgi:hypothetical protein